MRKFVTMISALAIATAFQGFADKEESTEPDHAIVEERPISDEQQEEIANQLREEYEECGECEECEEIVCEFGPCEEVSRDIWVQEVFYPDSYHWIVEPSILGDIITLEDGSHWTVRPSDRKKLFHWNLSDPVIITQNTSWFSKYNYKILNKYAGSDIEVNMSLGPIHDGEFTHWVSGIDVSRGQILLENGSLWNVSPSDYHIFKKWLLNDTIVIGANSSWFSSYEFILIDVETYTFVRANQLN